MGNVTRHALRVYAALAELKGNNADVLDALIPFFEPILEAFDEKIFDPDLFAKGVQHLYRWRFNKDIAEQFIPRLQRKGHLERTGDKKSGIYLVRYKRPPEARQEEITAILEKIIDHFESFPPRVTDLLTYRRSRDQLKDMLIRFLVSMDAYGEAAFRAEAEHLKPELEGAPIEGLEEGGTPVPREDRYMCARFVKAICEEKPEWIPHLARLASIGLLTEVVEDFLKPTDRAERVSLTIVVDAPLALDYLGCSGTALQRDVKTIFDALKAIGCSIVVFPASCVEMRRNLVSMLALQPAKRHGYTHEAMARGEVLAEFVQSVANNPERALEKVGIQVRRVSMDQYPNTHIHFSQERYDDFFEQVYWVKDLEPRTHDATCMALVMRLREARHNSDLFRCGYIFATRNATFVKESRKYCIQSQLISPFQEGPVVHQRELATVAWLRTGLGADEQIPRGHLLATCDRVLRIRQEVPEAVAAKLKLVTPEKLQQFELLLLDHRSMRALADETLNDENVVTIENSQHLLDVMRRATAEEERIAYEAELKQEKSKHREAQRKTQDKANAAETARDTALAARDTALQEVKALKAKEQARERAVVDDIVESINSTTRRIDQGFTTFLVIIGVLACIQLFTGWWTDWTPWKVVLTVGSLLGVYHLISDSLGKPKIDVAYALNQLATTLLEKKLEYVHLDHIPLEHFDLKAGQVKRKPVPSEEAEPTQSQSSGLFRSETRI